MNCIFADCNNKIPSYTIYEDDVKKFLDIHPGSNGHV